MIESAERAVSLLFVVVLILLAALTLLGGIGMFLASKSAIHEIAAIGMLLLAMALFTGALATAIWAVAVLILRRAVDLLSMLTDIEAELRRHHSAIETRRPKPVAN